MDETQVTITFIAGLNDRYRVDYFERAESESNSPEW